MNPLSLTTCIIAVLGASGGAASGLRKLASLRRAPDAILALINELSDS